MSGYLPLIQKTDIHMHGLAVYVKEGLPLVKALSLILTDSADSYLFLTGFNSLRLTSFSFIDHLLCFYAQLLMLFHLT